MAQNTNEVVINPTYYDSIVNNDSSTPLSDDVVIGAITPDGGGSTNDGNISEDSASFKEIAAEAWKNFDEGIAKVVEDFERKREEIRQSYRDKKEEAKQDIQNAKDDVYQRYYGEVDEINETLTTMEAPQLEGEGFFTTGINKIMAKGVEILATDGSETFLFLADAGAVFAKGLLEKAKGILMSNVYVPEDVYLLGLKALRFLEPNWRTRNDILRLQCIKHDYPRALAYLNEKVGIQYSNLDSRTFKEGILAAKHGAIRVVDYIMGVMVNEVKEQENGLKVLPTIINIDEEIIERLTVDLEDLKAICRKNLHILLKWMIIGSYAHLDGVRNLNPNTIGNTFSQMTGTLLGDTPPPLSKIIEKYDLHPSALGTTDKEFGNFATITEKDLDKFIPFWKKPSITNKSKKSHSFDESIVITTQTKTSGSFIADSMSSFLRKPLEDIIPAEYIVPRNANIKQIYVYLASTDIHGEYVMINDHLRARLKYHFYDDFIGLADKAMAGFYQTGLGKILSSDIAIDPAYLYAKKMEPLIFDPAKTVFLKVQDMVDLPAPKGPPPSNPKPPSMPEEIIIPKQGGTLEPIIETKTFGNVKPSQIIDLKELTMNEDGSYKLGYINWIEKVIEDLFNQFVIEPSGSLPQTFTGQKYTSDGKLTIEYQTWINAVLTEFQTITGSSFELGQISVTYIREVERPIELTFSGPVKDSNDKYTEEYFEWLESIFYKETEPNNIFTGSKYKADGQYTNAYIDWMNEKLKEKGSSLGETTVVIYEDLRTKKIKDASSKYKGVPYIDWTTVDVDDPKVYRQILLEYYGLQYGYNKSLILIPDLPED